MVICGLMLWFCWIGKHGKTVISLEREHFVCCAHLLRLPYEQISSHPDLFYFFFHEVFVS